MSIPSSSSKTRSQPAPSKGKGKDESLLNHPKLEELRRLLGLTPELLSMLVRYTDNKTNPICLHVCQIIGISVPGRDTDEGILKLREAGLGDLDDEDDYRETRLSYNILRNPQETREDPYTEKGRQSSWRTIGKTADDIRCLRNEQYFDDVELSDDALYHLVHFDSTQDLGRCQKSLGIQMEEQKVNLIATVCRWAFGNSLGYLNFMRVDKDFNDKEVSDQTSHYHSSRPVPQQIMLYEYFTTPFKTELLHQGIGLMPFMPFASTQWKLAKEYQIWDRDAVDQVLLEICQQKQITPLHACTEITKCQYTYSLSGQNEILEGMELIYNIIEILKTRFQRAYGPPRIIWGQITGVLDISASRALAGHHQIPLDDKQIQEFIQDSVAVMDPAYLMNKFPGIPQNWFFSTGGPSLVSITKTKSKQDKPPKNKQSKSKKKQ
ncbi:hypothetical protein V866_005402 [Kwoniella sp. B9012]